MPVPGMRFGKRADAEFGVPLILVQ
jgi:hypothetical protein